MTKSIRFLQLLVLLSSQQMAQVPSVPVSNSSAAPSATNVMQEHRPVQSLSYSGILVRLGDPEQPTVQLFGSRYAVAAVDSNKYKLKPDVTAYLISKKNPDELVGVITFHSGKLAKAYRDWTPADPSAYSLVLAIKGAVEATKNDGSCTLDTSSIQEPNYTNQGSSLICGSKYIEISGVESSRLSNKILVSIYEWLTDFSQD